MNLAVTVDVERGEGEDPYRSVDVLDSMVRQADRWTFFVTPDVVEHRADTVEGWSRNGHDVGLHVHPTRITGESDWLSEYSQDDIVKQLEYGCRVFESTLGFEPTLFRAGRWEHSEQLIGALGQTGFEIDCSLLPDRRTDPYVDRGITELPLTVHTNALLRLLLRPWTINAVPQTIDNFLYRPHLIPAYYALAYRIVRARPPYLMVAFHDYDTTSPRLRSRMRTYIDWLGRFGEQATVGNLNLE